MSSTRQEYYDTGVLKEEKTYKDGKLDGVSKHFNKTGKIKYEHIYKNGKDLSTKFYDEDGKLSMESITNDDKTSVTKMFNKNGKLTGEMNFKDGKQDGIDKQYDDNGEIIMQETYKDGERIEGFRKGSYKDSLEGGVVKYETIYKGNRINGLETTRYYRGNGILERELNYINHKQEGLQKEYSKTGELVCEKNYIGGKAEGVCKYYRNGKLDYEQIYKDDKLWEGPYKYYDQDGKLSIEESYKAGKKDGISKHYINGKPYSEVVYKNGVAEGTSPETNKKEGLNRVYLSGKLTNEENYKDGKLDGAFKRYNLKGILTEESFYKNDKKDGLQKVYDYSDGKLKLEQYYKDGLLDGSSKKYGYDGKLEEESNYKNGKKDGFFIKYLHDGSKIYTIYENDVKTDVKKYDKNNKLIFSKDYSGKKEEEVEEEYSKITEGPKVAMLASAYSVYGKYVDNDMFFTGGSFWNELTIYPSLKENKIPVYIIAEPGFCEHQEMRGILKGKGYNSVILDGSKPENLKQFDVIILYHVHNLRESIVSALEEYVKNGGGLVLVDDNGTGECETKETADKFVKMIGMETLAAETIKDDELGIKVLKEHEIIKGLKVNEVFENKITAVNYKSKSIDGDVLMEFNESKTIALKVKEYGKGKIAVLDWGADTTSLYYWSENGQKFGKYSGLDILRRCIEWGGEFQKKYYNNINLQNYKFVGKHYVQERDYENAKMIYKDVIGKFGGDPGSYDAYNEMFKIYMMLKDFKSAEEVCYKFLNVKPDKSKIAVVLNKLFNLYITEGEILPDDKIVNIIKKYNLDSSDISRFEIVNSFITNWWIVGPFGKDLEKDLKKTLKPERKAFNQNDDFIGINGKVKWKNHSLKDNDGYVALDSILDPSCNTVAYAYLTIDSDVEQKAKFFFGVNDQVELWFNDKDIIKCPDYGQAEPDTHKFDVTLNKGLNKILLKVLDSGGAGWGFYFRITDESGKPIKSIKIKK